MAIKKRRSIHPDKDVINKSEDEEVTESQPSHCQEELRQGVEYSKLLQDTKNDQQSKHTEDLEELKEQNENQPRLYPNLQEILSAMRVECAASASRYTIKKILIYFGIIILILGIVLAAIQTFKDVSSDEIILPFDVKVPKQTPREVKFDNELDSLEQTYSSQDEKVWYTLSAGIKSVLKQQPNQPSVFLLLFDSDKAGDTAKCLARDISKPATSYLMMEIQEPVIMSGVALQHKSFVDEPGLILVELNKTVPEKGVLIVTDLQDVPAKVAKSFHFVCDKYSPLIDKAVYFFTLRVDGFPSLNAQQTALKRLDELWSEKLEHNILQPLITRMTPNVLRIKSDYSNC